MAHLEMHNQMYRAVTGNARTRRKCHQLKTADYFEAARIAVMELGLDLGRHTLALAYWEAHKRFKEDLSPFTAEGYMFSFKRFCECFRPDYPISKIGPVAVATFKQWLQNRYTNQNTVSINLRHIQAVFSQMVKWDILESSPFLNQRGFIPPTQQRNDYLSPEEVRLLLATAAVNPLEQGYLMLLLRTGMRRGELYNLQWKDVTDSFLIINGKDDHRNRRKFPLWDSVKEALAQVRYESRTSKEGQKWVYISGQYLRHPHTANYVSRMVKKYIRRAGLRESLTVHSLRHTFATNLLTQDYPIRKLQRLMGHASLETTCRYDHEDVVNIPEVTYF